jgi:hypothetical protein
MSFSLGFNTESSHNKSKGSQASCSTEKDPKTEDLLTVISEDRNAKNFHKFLIENLNNIEKLDVGDKLSFIIHCYKLDGIESYPSIMEQQVHQISIDKSGAYQAISRIFNGQSRSYTLDNLSLFINHVFTVLEVLMAEFTQLSRNKYQSNVIKYSILDLAHHLNISMNGIENLKKTYASDSEMDSQLEVLINKIDTKVVKIDTLLKQF